MKALAALLALVASLASTSAAAQNTYTAYLDAAGHQNSGCNITLPGGTFVGADTRLQATVTPGNNPQVTSVTIARCQGGVWQPSSTIGGGYPVDLNMGVSGSDSIEFETPISGILTPNNPNLRMGFTAQNATGSDVLFTTDGSAGGAAIVLGVALPIPALGFAGLALLALLVAIVAGRHGRARRLSRVIALGLALGSGVAGAAWVLFDWTGYSPIATDPSGDSTNGSPDIDIRAAFAAFKAGTLYFRIDVSDVQTAPPQITSANATTFYVGKAGTFSVTASGVPTPALSISGCTLPSGVTFVDNGNGTATLGGTPASGTANTYNCTFTANNGIAPNATQAFTLTVANAPSQTALVSGTNPSVFGQSVTFTATVTPAPGGSGTPTGTVTFLDGATTLGTGTLNGSGVATFATAALSVATHPITAQYGGDTNFGPSTSLAVSQVVNRAGSTTALASNANPSVFGQSVTFTATVTLTAPGAGTATGTVTFSDGATTLGTGTLSGGVATFSTASLSVATHPITAAYGGDANVSASTSSTVNQVVNPSPTTTALVSSANPSAFNQNVTFTATVGATAPGAGTPTGTVTFKDGTGTLGTGALSAGVATFSTSTLSVATHPITAVYGGDADFASSTSSAVSQVVNQASQTISFTSTAPTNAVVSGPTYTVTATATSGLAVTFTIDATATSVCSISGSTVSFLASGTCVIDANQAGNANYSAAPQAQQSFGVGKNNQTIAFTSTAPVGAVVAGPTYTVTATASPSGLPVTFTIDATASSVCSISGATVSFIGAGTCVIDANQAGNANYNPAPQVQQSFAVGKGSQTITYTSTAPAAASVGGATYTVTATASSGLTVGFTIDASATAVCSISGSTVSFLSVGTCVIDANQPGDSNYNAAPQVQQSFAVGKGSQTISFTSTAPAGASVGGATYTVTATASPSGLPVAFTIDATASSVCSISGATVSFIGVGTCVIDANQPGNANYNAAAQVQQSFAVGKGSQTITFTSTAPSNALVSGPTYTVTATASSGLPVTFTIDATATSVCSISGATVSFTGAGTCVIDANQAGNANYNAAPQAQQSFAVSKNSQTITFTSTAPVGAVVSGPTYTVTATASPSGLPVTFTIDATATSVCSISGSTVSFIGAGTCVIDANQAGNANYNAAPQVQQSFAVGKGNQTISFTSTAPAGAAVGGATYTVTATATSGLPVTFTIDATATSVCAISGSTVSFIGAGTCVIDANQPGNANYNAAAQVQQSFAVAKGNQTITFTSTAPSSATFGGATYTVTATASSGLPVTFAIDATATSVCSISGATVSFTGVGTCVIDANQAGDANYNAAPQAQQSFAVGKASQTISFTSTAPTNALVGGPTYTVTATATSGLTVTFTIDATATSVCSISGSTVSFIGGGTCVIDANQAGNANYSAAPQAQQSFIVNKNNQTITFTSTAPSTAKNAGPTYTVTATASSGLTVTFTVDATATSVCSIAGSTVSFIGAGTCVIDANQAGNAAYNPAPQVQQSFLVAKGDQTLAFTSTLAAYSATGSTYTVTATASPSGLAVVFSIDASSTGGCSITGANTVHFNTPGTCVIDANQPGDSNWNPATQVQQSTIMEDPAVAGPDSHAVTGNVAIAVPAPGVLGNDTGTAIAIRSYGATTGLEQTTLGTATATAQGGSVTLNADGSYSYDPPANFTGTDTFKYVIGNDLPATATGTVTLTVSDRIMVVATAGVGAANCKPQSACTLATADSKPAVTSGKDLVFVESGSYGSASIALLANQALVGQKVSLSTALTDVGITLAPQSVVAPITAIGASTTPTLANAGTVVALGGGNLVEYFNLNPSSGSAIASANVTTGATVHDITITASASGGGVSITGNSTGSTFAFSNLVISTASGTAFSAVSPGPAATVGGTINITTGSTPNTLSTTTGVALNVVNTAIGASNMTFQSVTAGSPGSGPANGIVLNNTGTSGVLQVTGVGTTAGSGGTIQSTTAEGVLITSASATLTNLTITNPGTHGISSSAAGNLQITGLTFSDSAGNVASDDGIHAINTVTQLKIASSTISGARHQGITVDNFNQNLGTLAIDGTSVTGTPGGDGVLIQMRGSSVLTTGTIGTVSPNTFSNNSATGLQINNADTGNMTSMTIVGNTINANNAGIDLDIAQAASMNVNVLNNTITRSNSQALNIVQSTTATGGAMRALVKANNIGLAGVLDSGSAIGNGIRVANGALNVTVTIDGNIIREVPNGRGIDIEGQAYAGGGSLKAKIVNNQVIRPSGTNQNIGCGANTPCPLASVFVLSDSNNGVADNVCTVISSNTAYDPTSWPVGGEAAFYFARRTMASNTLSLEGTQANAVSQIGATNTITNLTVAPGIVDENAVGPVAIVGSGTCGTFP